MSKQKIASFSRVRTSLKINVAVTLLAVLVLVASPVIVNALNITTPVTRISEDSSSTEADDSSWGPSISDDGRYVAFESYATNLVAGDTNDAEDVFMRDTTLNTIIRISTDSTGTQANNDSYSAVISGNGRYVVFESTATNLVAGDTNSASDIFMKDTVTNATTRLSTDSSGTQSTSFSSSDYPSISSDGRYVSFHSDATNLVVGDTNGDDDVFLKDTVTGVTIRVSTNSSGVQGNDDSTNSLNHNFVSSDGRYVVFDSDADNLVTGDTNSTTDVFVKDTVSGAVVRASTDSSGVESDDGGYNPTLSSDGRYVAFESYGDDLVAGDTNSATDVFVKDIVTGSIVRATTDSSGVEQNDFSYWANISPDGNYVAFESDATNLVADDTNGDGDIFVKDLTSGTTMRISTDSLGNEANDDSYGFAAVISGNGRYFAFGSPASNLVAGDTNFSEDIFYRENPLWVAPADPVGGSEPEDETGESLVETGSDTILTYVISSSIVATSIFLIRKSKPYRHQSHR